jgi:hypothetical protein
MTRNRLKKHKRTAGGQAIAESAFGASFVVILIMGLMMLLLNSTTLGTRKVQVESVASAAAKSIMSDKYFLGMERPQYDLDSSSQNARDLADAMLDRIGLGKTTYFKAIPSGATIDGHKIDLVRVDLRVSVTPATPGFKILEYTIIPELVSIAGSGMASTASESKGYALGVVDFYNLDNPKQSHAFFLPLYSAELVNGNVQAGDKSYDANSSNTATGSNDPNYSGWSAGDPAGITRRGSMPNNPGTIHLTVGVRDNCDATSKGTLCIARGSANSMQW